MKSSSGFAAVAAFGRSVFHRQHASCGRSGLCDSVSSTRTDHRPAVSYTYTWHRNTVAQANGTRIKDQWWMLVSQFYTATFSRKGTGGEGQGGGGLSCSDLTHRQIHINETALLRDGGLTETSCVFFPSGAGLVGRHEA